MRDGGRGGSLSFLALFTNGAGSTVGQRLGGSGLRRGGIISSGKRRTLSRPREIGVEAMSQMKAIPEAFRDAVPAEKPSAVADHGPDPRPGRYGEIYVVRFPASDAELSGITEAAYRAFEIALASIGLILALPLMLAIAVLIRLDSPGPVLFRHRRPARSICVRGRDLEGRKDLCPAPGRL